MTINDDPPIDRTRIALGIQQPWAELILCGLKSIEVRSQPTQVRGTIYLYASKQPSTLEAAFHAAEQYAVDVPKLPLGVLVGTIDILDSRPCTSEDVAASCLPVELLQSRQAWILGNPRRFVVPKAVRFLPYGVWFYPFQRKGS